jgi:predicted HTH domain antitoxin
MKTYRNDLARLITMDLIREKVIHHDSFGVASKLIRARLNEAKQRIKADPRIAPYEKEESE